MLVGVVGLRPNASSQVPSGSHWVERLRGADSVAAMSFETVEQLQLMPRVAASGRIAEVDWEPARCGSNCDTLENPFDRYPSLRFSVTLDGGGTTVLRTSVAPVLSKDEVSAIARDAVGTTVVVTRLTGEVRPELVGAPGLDRPGTAPADAPTVDPNGLLVRDGDRWRPLAGGEVAYARRGESAAGLADRINTADRQLDRGEIPVSSVLATLRD
jgi:hypothetical protein